jgi:RNA polymerase primary sigma factor
VKYGVAQELARIEPDEVTAEQYNAVAASMEQIEELRQRIIRANLRLVVSIAKKHVGWSPAFFEVISDGNMSLMRAAEKFDFSRGTKFSTYASWAVMKNYARSIPEQHYHYTRYVTGQEGVIDSAPDAATEEESSYQSDRQHVRDVIRAGMNELPEREREIVSHHFGLGGKGKALTLDQLGKRFGVTKERVRQIEQHALAHLREVLSPTLADALT